MSLTFSVECILHCVIDYRLTRHVSRIEILYSLESKKYFSILFFDKLKRGKYFFYRLLLSIFLVKILRVFKKVSIESSVKKLHRALFPFYDQFNRAIGTASRALP